VAYPVQVQQQQWIQQPVQQQWIQQPIQQVATTPLYTTTARATAPLATNTLGYFNTGLNTGLTTGVNTFGALPYTSSLNTGLYNGFGLNSGLYGSAFGFPTYNGATTVAAATGN
jgi:hypothetical protein